MRSGQTSHRKKPSGNTKPGVFAQKSNMPNLVESEGQVRVGRRPDSIDPHTYHSSIINMSDPAIVGDTLIDSKQLPLIQPQVTNSGLIIQADNQHKYIKRKKPSLSKQSSAKRIKHQTPSKQIAQIMTMEQSSQMAPAGLNKSSSQYESMLTGPDQRQNLRQSSISPMKDRQLKSIQVLEVDPNTRFTQLQFDSNKRTSNQQPYGLNDNVEDPFDQVRVKLPQSKSVKIPLETSHVKFKAVRSSMEKADKQIQQIQQHQGGYIWQNSGYQAVVKHRKKKQVESSDFSQQKPKPSSRFFQEDCNSQRRLFKQNNQVTESDKEVEPEDQRITGNSEILLLPQLNKKIKPKQRNLRNFASQNTDQTNSEPQSVSMYGGEDSSGQISNEFSTSKPKEINNITISHQHRKYPLASEYALKETHQPLIRPQDINYKRGSLQQSETKINSNQIDTDNFDTHISHSISPVKTISKNSLIHNASVQVPMTLSKSIEERSFLLGQSDQNGLMQRAMREQGNLSTINARYYKNYEIFKQSQEKNIFKPKMNKSSAPFKEVDFSHKKALQNITQQSYSNPPMKSPYQIINNSSASQQASFVSSNDEESSFMKLQNSKSVKSSNNLQIKNLQLVQCTDNDRASRNNGDIRKKSRSPIALSQNLRNDSNKNFDRRTPDDEMNNSRGFFPFIEKQKREAHTSLGVGQNVDMLVSMETEEDKGISKKRLSNKYANEIEKRDSKKELKVQDDFNLDKAMSEEGGTKGNISMDAHHSTGSFPPTKYQITLDQKVEAPARVAGPGNVPFQTMAQSNRQSERNSQMLFEQLSPEKLVQLIKEQQHKYPELNALTADQLSHLLYSHMLKDSQKTPTEQTPNPFQNKQISAMINYSTPTKIVNHFNITINHQPVQSSSQEPGQSNGGIQIAVESNKHNQVQNIIVQPKEQQQDLQLSGSTATINPQTLYKQRVKKKSAYDPNIRLGRQLIRQSQNSASQNQAENQGENAQTSISIVNQVKEPQRPTSINSHGQKSNLQNIMPTTPGGTTPQQTYKVNPDVTTPTTATLAPMKNGIAPKKDAVAPKQMNGIHPKIDLSCLTTPDIAQIDSTNAPCIEIRTQMQAEKDWLPAEKLDMLVITFDGVIGTFFSHETMQGLLKKNKMKRRKEEKTDVLFLRPGVSQALENILPHLRICILVTEKSLYKQKCIMKTLKKYKVPYDCMYQIQQSCTDNFFTYNSMWKETDEENMQILFLTAQKFTNNQPRRQIDKLVNKSQPKTDYSALPVALDMERLMIFCVPHLLAEAELENLEGPIENFDKIQVCDMTAAAQTIVNFINTSRSFSENELLTETQNDKKKKSKGKSLEKNKGLQRLASTSGAGKIEEKQKNSVTNSSLKLLKKTPTEVIPLIPPKDLSVFQLLTSINEHTGDSLYPINFFQDEIIKLRSRNTFFKAFAKAQRYELFSLNYYQLQNFSKLILGQRLEGCMVRIQMKLNKIKQAMRKVQKERALDPDEKSFRFNLNRYEACRRQPAFQSYRIYNNQYYSEVYDECQVRLPLHPSKDQFDKLQAIYKQLQSRLDNLVNNTFTFSEVSQPEKGLENSYYNLMLFKSHLFQFNPIVKASECPRIQFELKIPYARITQNAPKSAIKNWQPVEDIPLKKVIEVQENQTKEQNETKVQGSTTAVIDNSSQESPRSPRKRLDLEIPDLLSWMSIQSVKIVQPNIQPNHQQMANRPVQAGTEYQDSVLNMTPIVKIDHPSSGSTRPQQEKEKDEGRMAQAKVAMQMLVSELEEHQN